jgi:hypothetical protein
VPSPPGPFAVRSREAPVGGGQHRASGSRTALGGSYIAARIAVPRSRARPRSLGMTSRAWPAAREPSAYRTDSVGNGEPSAYASGPPAAGELQQAGEPAPQVRAERAAFACTAPQAGGPWPVWSSCAVRRTAAGPEGPVPLPREKMGHTAKGPYPLVRRTLTSPIVDPARAFRSPTLPMPEPPDGLRTARGCSSGRFWQPASGFQLLPSLPFRRRPSGPFRGKTQPSSVFFGHWRPKRTAFHADSETTSTMGAAPRAAPRMKEEG